MPRIRSIKPEIHQDEAIGELSDSAFRLFIGLITQADDYGNLKGGLQLLVSQVWPHRPRPTEEVDGLLDELVKAELIVRYTVERRPFISLPGWENHQRISNAGKPQVPGLEKADSEGSPRVAAVRGDSRLDQGGDQGEDQGSKEAAAVAAAAGDQVLGRLERVTDFRNLPLVEPLVLAKIRRDFPDVDLLPIADDFAHYWTDGGGARTPLRDVAGAFRRQVSKKAQEAPAAAGDPGKYAPYEARVQVVEV